ncbi:MAG: NADH-quinone oxidoreductase subunit J [Chloroflexi bacterium]|nr:NADH-quinone oxidoreductase subunit J [Chloroflexota bacterium]
MEWLFLVVSFVAVLAAGMMLTRQNAVHSALFLIVNFGCVAFLYLMLDAPFLAMVQVTVYTGAIMVLFLFVIMLLGAEATTDTSGRLRWLGFAGTAVAIILLMIFAFPLASDMLADESVEQPDTQAQVRVINAIPAGEGESFTIVDMGRSMTLEGTVTGTVMLDSADNSLDDWRVDDVAYDYARDATQHYSVLPAGAYNVIAGVELAEFATSPLLTETVDLTADSAHSVVFYENVEGIVDIVLLEDDVRAPSVGTMRLAVFNAVTDKQVSLIDIGQYTDRRSLCEDDSCSSVIPHRVLINQLPAGQKISLELEEGAYNLAFVDQDQSVLRTLADYEASRGVIETRVLVQEPGIPGSQPTYRAAVFTAIAKPAFGSPEAVGQVLFIEYVLPVMLVGMLLLVALIGVIVLARPDALAQAERRRINRRRRVNRPLVSVISQQTGADVLSGDYLAKLPGGSDDDSE